VSLSQTGGSLGPGATATVEVFINTESRWLGVGIHNDTVTFTNTTSGLGNTTRPVKLTVISLPTLSVAPANRDVTATAGTTTFTVSNTGGGTFDWVAEVVSGGEWLSIPSGPDGTDEGTITVAFTTNPGILARQGTIQVTAVGAAGSPKLVTVTQPGGSLSLSLSGERLVERAWIVQREYGELNLRIDRSPTVVVNSYVVYRKVSGQDYQVLDTLPGDSFQGSQLVYRDKFLDEGVGYSYRIVAFDAPGTVLQESNEIVI
jgi:hypothetical protein